MRLRTIVLDRLYDDTAELQILFAPGDKDTAERVADNFTEESSHKFILPASGVLAVPFGSVTSCRGLYIDALGDFDLLLNGDATLAIRRRPGASATERAYVHLDSTITSIQITNISATATLEGRYAIWGDPA